MSEVWQLFQLQQADSKLSALVKEIMELKGENAHKILYTQRKNDFEGLKNQLKDKQKALKEATHAEDELQHKKSDLNKLLYSGKSFNAKELGEQEAELNNTKSQISQLEEQMLELMDEVESLQKAVDEGAKSMVLWEREAVQRQAAINRKIVRLADDAKALKARRDAMAQEVPELLMHRYNDLRRQKGGVAVAIIEKDSCSGCGMKLTNHKIQEVASGALTLCGTCCRVLYKKA